MNVLRIRHCQWPSHIHRFEGARFPSVEAALAHGPKFFEELMTAVGSRDGREIVRTLEALRQRGLDRDGEGRYLMPSAAR